MITDIVKGEYSTLRMDDDVIYVKYPMELNSPALNYPITKEEFSTAFNGWHKKIIKIIERENK
jgi:hypothetical protein